MRAHGVRRVFAMSTLSLPQPRDGFSLVRLLLVALVFVVANKGWRTARGIARTFETAGEGIDYTVFRIAGTPGGCDEEAWRRDREDGMAFEGWIGGKGGCTGRKGRRWRGGWLMQWRVGRRNGLEKCWLRVGLPGARGKSSRVRLSLSALIFGSAACSLESPCRRLLHSKPKSHPR
ncbi:hypothetical protein VUR80DRAFT_10253 [Thermomyces stellatus]